MRSFWIAVSLAMAASPAYAQVSKTSLIDWGFYSVTGLVTSDNPSFSARAQARANGVTPAGGIYEIKLRIPYQDIEGYLADYKTFFLPVDQYVCSTTSVFTNKGANCESSGRKLVSVLTREHGDQFNLVFLY